MAMSGQCPVQGYAVVDGWLCYFRARDGWSLRAWRPGRWRPVEYWGRNDAETAVHALVAHDKPADLEGVFSAPDFEIEDADGEEGFPQPNDDENWYEGWWSHEYAGKVAEWSIGRLRSHILEEARGLAQRWAVYRHEDGREFRVMSAPTVGSILREVAGDDRIVAAGMCGFRRETRPERPRVMPEPLDTHEAEALFGIVRREVGRVFEWAKLCSRSASLVADIVDRYRAKGWAVGDGYHTGEEWVFPACRPDTDAEITRIARLLGITTEQATALCEEASRSC